MNVFFKRQMADYVEYHRDPWNCAMHVFGIVILFFAAVLPLSLVPVRTLGAHATLAPLLALPVLLYWLLLDVSLGATLLGFAAILFWAAALVVDHASTAIVWSVTVPLIVVGIACQIIGHRVFERRQPALVDNPSHLLLGPMFVVAKLLIALGFRRDLADIIGPTPPQRGASPFVEENPAEPLPRS